MAGVRRDAGDEIGGYTVVGTLGRGGSGAVYRVRDGAGSEAALKLVDARDDEVAARRLEREVHALQSLRHPAVPRVLDAELDGDEKFVVFEYIPGTSLWQYIQDHGPLAGEELAEFADRTASALEAVHAAGVVHRDVTPSNIMMSPEGPMLIDFGLSHREHDERLTRDGLVSGTAGYVAPEVIDGAEPGPIADRWAWAATVAYTMTGVAPFGAGTGAISRTLESNVELPDVPGALALRAALSRDIGARPGLRDTVAALRGATTVMPRSSDQIAPTQVAPGLAPTAVMGDAGIRPAPVVDPTAVMATEEVWHTDTVASPVSSDGLGRRDGDLAQASGELSEAGDDGYDDSEPVESEIPLPFSRRHPVMTVTWMVAIAASAALAPFIAAVGLLFLAVTVRAVQHRAVALHGSRQRRGERRGDAALHTLGFPWHLLRSLGETVPAALVAFAAGGGVAGLGWWLISSGTIDVNTADARAWGQAAALACGGLVAATLLWWGPLMEATREGGRRSASALAPTRGVAVAWVVVALTAIGVVVLAVYLEAEPWWWPAIAVMGR